MPELPEVETTRRGLAPHVVGRRIVAVEVREPRLRWLVKRDLPQSLAGRRIEALRRRAKYLLFAAGDGTLLLHLGMSGSLRYLPHAEPPRPHDHVDICLEGGGRLRFNDPRRFGSLHFTTAPDEHPLLKDLGPEPLEAELTAHYLWQASRGRRVAIKQHLMNSRVVVGVGNIYANEALYRAGIHPARAAGRIARARFDGLVGGVQDVLTEAIGNGGTTLRNFVGGDGRPGYFRQALKVYERDGRPCERCSTLIRRIVQGQRATYYCANCQR